MKPKIKKPVRIAPEAVAATAVETDERFACPELPGADVVSIALDLEGWRPASEVLDRVTAVPTRFFDFDLRNTVGGLPVRRIHTVSGPTTGGKAQRLDAKILTPDGWDRFGDLKVGDEVIGRDGRTYHVTGVYPRGVLPLYEVGFSDGASIVCCAEHLWYTTSRHELFGPEYDAIPVGAKASRSVVGDKGSVKTLAEIAADPPRFHEIPLVEPVYFRSQAEPLPIDPYLLGLYLGDGSTASGSSPVFCNPEPDIRARWVELQSPDDEVVDIDPLLMRVRRRVPSHHEGTALMRSLRRLGLAGCRSYEKHVPEQYLRATPEDRLALLRGLIDTDGHVVREGNDKIEYTTTSPRLAEAVLDLVRGLGGIATARWRTTRYDHHGEKKDGRPSARIYIWFQNGIVPVSSRKHLGRLGNPQMLKRVRRSIVSVEPVGEAACMCIRVDAPDNLYVTDDYVVTHNTAFVLGLLESFIDRGHIGAYVDAEHATGQEFVEFLLDKLAHSPNFYARRPKSYEETMDQVDALIERIAKLRVGVSKKKDEPAVPGLPDLCSILVVDSINKLVPERELKAMRTVGADEIAKGHFGRLRAAINQAWLDHVVPILADANMAFVAIAQEREESDGTGGGWSVKQAEDLLVHIKGGRALQFDASMLMRVTRKHAVFDSDAANGKSDDEKVQEARKREPIVGWAHRVRIRKSKVGQLEGSYTDCTYFTSTGRGMAPAGFDRVRDAVMVATNLGLIQVTGAWYSWHRFRSQGRRKLLAKFYEDAAAREELFDEVRAAINNARTR